MKTLSIAALTVLSQITIKGNLAFLPVGQLDRKLYVEVNGTLENFGGKWSRKDQAHVFPSDPTDLLEEVVQTGGYVKQKSKAQQLGFFETPPNVAKMLMEFGGFTEANVAGLWVLEPSAGRGALVRAFPKGAQHLAMVDVDEAYQQALLGAAPNGSSVSLVIKDFLAVNNEDVTGGRLRGEGFDIVIMNPPFSKQADIDHVLHALTFLRPGGRLAAIMSASTLYRENSKAVKFRKLIRDMGGEFKALPEGSFLPSGTATHTVMLRVTL